MHVDARMKDIADKGVLSHSNWFYSVLAESDRAIAVVSERSHTSRDRYTGGAVCPNFIL